MLALTVQEVVELFSPKGAYEPSVVNALMPVVRVGLGYLPLGQPLSTLSGGEAQRLKLARALSEPPNKTLFVLDEPSAGLHAADVEQVTKALHALVAEGASVVVVEHDLDIIAAADWIIDLGPGAGPDGGRVVSEGTPAVAMASGSLTGVALRDHLGAKGKKARGTARDAEPSRPDGIVVEHAREHNLKTHLLLDPARSDDGRDRAQRVGQIVSRVRRGVC